MFFCVLDNACQNTPDIRRLLSGFDLLVLLMSCLLDEDLFANEMLCAFDDVQVDSILEYAFLSSLLAEDVFQKDASSVFLGNVLNQRWIRHELKQYFAELRIIVVV